jgi:hypothetical protein
LKCDRLSLSQTDVSDDFDHTIKPQPGLSPRYRAHYPASFLPRVHPLAPAHARVESPNCCVVSAEPSDFLSTLIGCRGTSAINAALRAKRGITKATCMIQALTRVDELKTFTDEDVLGDADSNLRAARPQLSSGCIDPRIHRFRGNHNVPHIATRPGWKFKNFLGRVGNGNFSLVALQAHE